MKIIQLLRQIFRSKKFRSNGEKRIAEFFDNEKIEYKYEKRIKIENKIFYPDFYLKKWKIYLEYFGKTNDEKYIKRMKYKMALYNKHDIKYIRLYPYDLKNLKNSFYYKLNATLRNS